MSINKGRNGKAVEDLHEELPTVSIPIFSQDFIVKAVLHGYPSAFMISTENGYLAWEHYF